VASLVSIVVLNYNGRHLLGECLEAVLRQTYPDKEVIVYRNEQELFEKVCYYLAHMGQAEMVRRAGHRRALRDHTYQRRFQQLFAEIGLS